MENLVPDLAVMGLGGGGLQAVDDPAGGVHAHMDLNAEV